MLFFYLALVLGLSSLLGYVIRELRLPLIVAYILAGVLLSPFPIFNIHMPEALRFLPEIGIAFVLFFVGMELDLKEIRSLGKPIVVAALTQIIISSFAGFLIARVFGFPPVESLFLGFGLSVSSTIVVIKLLLDKKDLASLYGKLSLGILLVEDLVAVVILMVLATGSSLLNIGPQSALPYISLAIKGIILFVAALILSRYILSRVFRVVAGSVELLFLSALAWCFVFIAASLALGFSVIIGAFLAGVALATSPFHYEIQGRVKPLRDFFVVLFFVYLGSQVVFGELAVALPIIAVLTLFTLFIKPLIFMSILSIFGFKKHTIFQTSLNLSQISEFSLVIMLVGLSLGLTGHTSLTVIAFTGVLSIILSSVMISFSKQIYSKVSHLIAIFEHKKFTHETERKAEFNLTDHVVLIGAHRLGSAIFRFLRREKVPLLIVDFNPNIIEKLLSENINALHGDIGDPEIVDYLNLSQARLIISTAQDREDNLMLLFKSKQRKLKAPVIVRASSVEDTRTLYGAGADYVIFPEIIASDFVRESLSTHWPNVLFFKDRAKIELNKLNRNDLAY